MQPFAAIKNPKINVQTKKQPPAHRYPVPYAIVQPSVPNTGGTLPQKVTKAPFAEDTAKAFFGSDQQFDAANEFAAFENPQDRDRDTLHTPVDLKNGLRVQNKVNSLEETPASLIKGPKFNEGLMEDPALPRGRGETHLKQSHTESSQMQPAVQGPEVSESEFLKKKISPEKRVVGMRDDDEYVRMASADEEEEEEPVVQKKKEHNLHSQKGRIEPQRRYQDEDIPNLNKTPNMSQFEDTSALLKLKRIELELAKEKKRCELFESEQMKLIHANTELKRRVEELNARTDLAERYDNREKLAKREEEAERLKLEVNRLTEENRILEEHSQKLLQANSVYRQESDVLIASQQAEKRRLQEEIQELRRQLDERENPRDTLRQRNEILESQLVELREQVSLLTNQLTVKAHTNQKMNDFSEEIQSIVSTLSNVAIQTQTQAASLYSQHAQTSPVQFAAQKFPVATIDTQTHSAPLESHHAQTSPMIVASREKSQASPVKTQEHPPIQSRIIGLHHQSPTKVGQQKSNPISPDKLHGAPVNIHTSPSKEVVNILNVESPEKAQSHQHFTDHQQSHTQGTPQHEPPVQHNYYEENKISFEGRAEEIEGPPQIIFQAPDQSSELFNPVHQMTASQHQQEEDPQMVRPPTNNPPHHTQPLVEVEGAQPGLLDSFNTAESHEKVSGSGLMAPPKYKVPVRQIPKKAVPGFKPMTHQTNPFSEEKAESHQEQAILFGNFGSPEKTQEAEIAQHSLQAAAEVPMENQQEPIFSHPPEEVQFNVQSQESPQHEQPMHHEPPREENLEGPPRSVLPHSTAAPPMSKSFVPPSRIPVPKVVPGKAKLQKIGKNPFSSENETEVTDVFGSNASQERPPEVTAVHNLTHMSQEVAPPSHFESGSKLAQEDLAKSFSYEPTTGAAENFFDQLARGPSSTSDTGASQERGTSELMKSFQTEGGLSASVENSRPPITKAVAVKKKKGALPSDMFA